MKGITSLKYARQIKTCVKRLLSSNYTYQRQVVTFCHLPPCTPIVAWQRESIKKWHKVYS